MVAACSIYRQPDSPSTVKFKLLCLETNEVANCRHLLLGKASSVLIYTAPVKIKERKIL